MKAALTTLLVLSILSTVAHAQKSASNSWDGFHLAIVKADRTAAASVLAADVQIFESGFVERSRDEYLSNHFESDAKFAKALTRKVTKRSEQMAGNMADWYRDRHLAIEWRELADRAHPLVVS